MECRLLESKAWLAVAVRELAALSAGPHLNHPRSVGNILSTGALLEMKTYPCLCRIYLRRQASVVQMLHQLYAISRLPTRPSFAACRIFRHLT